MSRTPHRRAPESFRLDDPAVIVAPPEAADPFVLAPEAGEGALPAVIAPVPPRRRFSWSALFWASLGALVLLGLGLAVTSLVEDLFARSQALGVAGLVFAALTALALVVIVGREAFGLARLATIEALRERAAAVLVSDDRDAGRGIVDELLRLLRRAPRLAHARGVLERHKGDIIDGADLVRLAERELMATLDAQARRLVANAATRVSVVTAVSPRAAVDMIFVVVTAFGLIRALAYLYGGRPGTLGLVRLAKLVVSHLALTGGMAASDSVVQQMFGHGLAAKLSTRLGEGVLNGLLTARVGLAAIEVTRPLPFAALPRPALRDLAAGLLRRAEKAE